MSISRHIEEYLDRQGIEEKAEVVPESDCQVFPKDVYRPEDELAAKRALVQAALESNPK
ncbi:hypothetical protein QVA66_11185 [Staphylococcus chromogenes]|nr:hypothetical protein [Staphylococcus chromogenes]